MGYANESSFLFMVFVLPTLFGLTLLGEGISKVMNYNPRGWIGIVVGCGFLGILIVAFFALKIGEGLF